MKKSYTSAFKTQVILELLKDEKSLTQLASEYSVHPTVVREPKGNCMSQPEFPTELKLRSRPSTAVQLKEPTDTYESLERVAAARDMPVDALLKLYIGQGLRQDLAQRFADHVLDLTAQVLARHGQSPEQVEAILREIRGSTGS